MKVTLELKADEARVLQEIARTAGTTVEAVLHALIVQVSPPQSAEAAAEDPDAVAERRREQEEVEANVRRWHEEQATL